MVEISRQLILVVIRYRSAHQEGADEDSFKHLKEVSHSERTSVVLKICWKGDTVEFKQSRRFLECIKDNFQTQVTEESAKKGICLDLILMSKEELIGGVKSRGSLDCNYQWWTSGS